MNKAVLHLTSISKNFTQNGRTITVLDNITTEFVQGNSYAITGTSGTGKSTLLHLIAGLDTPTSGSLSFNCITLNTLSSTNLSLYLNKTIGLVFQTAHLIKELSVVENIMLPGLIANKNKGELIKKATTLLEKMDLLHKKNSPPAELSGGQQQRVALARALINEPLFLIADEPTGNLDSKTSDEVMEIFGQIQTAGNTVVLVTHEEDIAAHAKRVVRLRDGNIESDRLREMIMATH